MKKKYIIYVISVFLILWIFGPSVVVHSQPAIPREDAVYVIGAQWGPPTTWNPYSPTQTWGVGLFLYLPLFIYTWYKDAWLPMIASRYEWVSGDVIRVYIRPEASWSDGKPITAYDVESTYSITQKLKIGPGTGCWDYVEYIKAVGDKVVEAKIKDPPRNYFSFVGCVLAFTPLPRHVIEPLYAQMGDKLKEWKNDDVAKQVVSGPYKLYFYSDDRVVYARIDDWWGKTIFGLPKPKYLVHIIYKDNPSANLAFEQGDADWAGTFIPSVWQLFTKDIRTWYGDKPYYVGEGVTLLYINYKKTALTSPAVRKAIAYAIPYSDMLEKAYFGYGVQASLSMVNDLIQANKQWIDSDLCAKTWGSPDCRIKTDLEKAAKILDEAGYKMGPDGIRVAPDGTKLSGFTISVPYGWTDWMAMCEMIAANLKKIGIDVRTEFPDFSVWWQRIIDGTYDIIIGWSAGPSYDHPWNVYRFVLDQRLTPPSGNWANYKNPEIPALLDQAASTTDPAVRKQIYNKIQEIIYRDLPAIPLFYGAHWYAYNTKYWIGWPNNENPWWFPVAPWAGGNLPVLFGIAKRGETPVVPQWLKPVEQGGLLISTSSIWDSLAKTQVKTTTPTAPVTTPMATTVTIPYTVTKPVVTTSMVTVVSTQTIEKTVTTIDIPMTIILGIVTLVVGLGIGYLVFRRR
ncbi:MAG: ABC transporter substrate-binding protein [Sulfolobales archaeon]